MVRLIGLEGVTGRALEDLDAVDDLDSLTQSLDTPYWPLADTTQQIVKALSPSPLEGSGETGAITPAIVEILAGIAATAAVAAPSIIVDDVIVLVGLSATAALGAIGLLIAQGLSGVAGTGLLGLVTISGAWTPVRPGAETWTETADSSDIWIKTTPSVETWT